MSKVTIEKRIFATVLALVTILAINTHFPITAKAANTVYGFGISTANVAVLDKNSRSQIGTIYSKEGCTIVDYTSYGDYYLINYSVSGGNGYKEGLVPKNRITAYPNTICATIDRNYSVWYGPNANKFGTIGSLSAGEKVTVLEQEKDGYWDYIEYNAGGGLRKRGYVPREYLQYDKSLLQRKPTPLTFKKQGNKTFYIYAGPTDVYYKIENVYLTEYTILDSLDVWGLDVKYIEYTTPNDSHVRRGYIINQ
jgi:hypothetical protein